MEFEGKTAITMLSTSLLQQHTSYYTLAIIPLRAFLIRCIMIATLSEFTIWFILWINRKKNSIQQIKNRIVQFINVLPFLLLYIFQKYIPIQIILTHILQIIKIIKLMRFNNLWLFTHTHINSSTITLT